MKASRIEWRTPLRKVVRAERSAAGSAAQLECGHELVIDVQVGQRVRCAECPKEAFYG